jgi:MFS family permease
MALLVWNLPFALVIGIILSAFAAGSLQTVSSALPGDIVGPRQQGMAIGFIHTAGDIGSAVGPLIAYALLPLLGLSGIYLLCAGLYLIQMIPVFRRSIKQKRTLLPANIHKDPESSNL